MNLLKHKTKHTFISINSENIKCIQNQKKISCSNPNNSLITNVHLNKLQAFHTKTNTSQISVELNSH